MEMISRRAYGFRNFENDRPKLVGIGGLKTRAHHESARNYRPGEWTCDDVEAARLMANQTGRPWGAAGLTPDQAWLHRRPIDQEDRSIFGELVVDFAEEARVEQGY